MCEAVVGKDPVSESSAVLLSVSNERNLLGQTKARPGMDSKKKGKCASDGQQILHLVLNFIWHSCPGPDSYFLSHWVAFGMNDSDSEAHATSQDALASPDLHLMDQTESFLQSDCHHSHHPGKIMSG